MEECMPMHVQTQFFVGNKDDLTLEVNHRCGLAAGGHALLMEDLLVPLFCFLEDKALHIQYISPLHVTSMAPLGFFSK